jgi:hypothetical protein
MTMKKIMMILIIFKIIIIIVLIFLEEEELISLKNQLILKNYALKRNKMMNLSLIMMILDLIYMKVWLKGNKLRPQTSFLMNFRLNLS